MVSTVAAYVDPRPIQPPVLGLVASARNVVVGSDYDSGNLVNPTADQAESDTATMAQVPVTETSPASDIERPSRSAPVRWINGFSYRPEICNGGDIIDPDGTSIGTPPTMNSAITVRPYIVEGVDKRSTFGAPSDGDFEEARGFARRQLLACESKQIAKELWTGKLTDGTLTGNPYLADSNVVLPEGNRLLGWTTALAVIEHEAKAATCGQQIMIHARADTVAIWDMGGALRRVGNLILTINDSIVVPDAGYDGSGPGGAAAPSADSAWAYATTIVDIRRSDFISPQVIVDRIDPSTNLLTTYWRRIAAATWGCLQLGVHVDHLNATTTTGS